MEDKVNLLKEVACHLEFCGLGRVDGDIFWGRMPDGPEDCVGVFAANGGLPGAETAARVQILARARETGGAYARACRIAEALDGFNGFLHGGGAAAKIEAAGASGRGEDEKKREMYMVEIRVKYGENE